MELELHVSTNILLFLGLWTSFSHKVLGDIKILKLDEVKEFTCGVLNYRTFLLDLNDKILYVGAMNKIFRVDLQKFEKSSCDVPTFDPSDADKEYCRVRLKPTIECQNHIRVIQKIDSDTIYICGTNAFKPKNLLINTQTFQPLSSQPKWILSGQAKCPFDPNVNATTIWIKEKTPGNLPALFYGGTEDFAGAFTLILRDAIYKPGSDKPVYPYVRTDQYDRLALADANFVAVFDIGDYLYFFFREISGEHANCGKMVYSRVARVCKKDEGSKIAKNKWSTFVKARLNCSIPGEFPFYFNEIQSVYKTLHDNTKFYAVFTTSQHGLVGSAICTFHFNEIENSFKGKFKQPSKNKCAWSIVPSSEEPKPKPGTCPAKNMSLPDDVLTFINSHSLMDLAVKHSFGEPIFYEEGTIFTHVVVKESNDHIVYFAGTDHGIVYKILQLKNESQLESNLLVAFAATYPEAIRNMEISLEHQSLYVASDSKILQIALVGCHHYENCLDCIQDPDCGWNAETKICKNNVPQTHLLQDVKRLSRAVCDITTLPTLNIHLGQTLHLECLVIKKDPSAPIIWLKNNIIVVNSDKYIYTLNHGLIITNAVSSDEGIYEMRTTKRVACQYTVVFEGDKEKTPEEKRTEEKRTEDTSVSFASPIHDDNGTSPNFSSTVYDANAFQSRFFALLLLIGLASYNNLHNAISFYSNFV